MYKTEVAVLTFIREELKVQDYTDASLLFCDHSIDSFQILEIVLEIERQRGQQVSLHGIGPDTLSSLEGLLHHTLQSSATGT